MQATQYYFRPCPSAHDMTSRILVPYDGTSAARSAAEYAWTHFTDAEIVLLFVMDPVVEHARIRSYPGYTGEDEFANEHEKGTQLLETVQESSPTDVTVTTDITAGRPSQTIIEYIDEEDFDQIVIGSHSRDGLARFLLGSTAETVLRRSPIPVTVVRPPRD